MSNAYRIMRMEFDSIKFLCAKCKRPINTEGDSSEDPDCPKCGHADFLKDCITEQEWAEMKAKADEELRTWTELNQTAGRWRDGDG
jgi:DNA-directed RNA polymerase subunit RPC12/RpoP